MFFLRFPVQCTLLILSLTFSPWIASRLLPSLFTDVVSYHPAANVLSIERFVRVYCLPLSLICGIQFRKYILESLLHVNIMNRIEKPAMYNGSTEYVMCKQKKTETRTVQSKLADHAVASTSTPSSLCAEASSATLSVSGVPVEWPLVSVGPNFAMAFASSCLIFSSARLTFVSVSRA